MTNEEMVKIMDTVNHAVAAGKSVFYRWSEHPVAEPVVGAIVNWKGVCLLGYEQSINHHGHTFTYLVDDRSLQNEGDCLFSIEIKDGTQTPEVEILYVASSEFPRRFSSKS